MGGIISKEFAESFRRWEPGSFDARTTSPEAEMLPPPSPNEALVEPEIAESELHPLKLPTAEDIERVHQEAHAEGYAEGFTQGQTEGHAAALAEGRAAQQAVTERLESLANQLNKALETVDQDIAEDLLAFAIELARQMVSASLVVRADAILPTIREAMAALPLHHGAVSVHLHPNDVQLARQHFGEQLTHAGWRLIEDRDIQAGGCKLISGSSEVDATVGTRWRRILETIGAKPEWLEPSPE